MVRSWVRGASDRAGGGDAEGRYTGDAARHGGLCTRGGNGEVKGVEALEKLVRLLGLAQPDAGAGNRPPVLGGVGDVREPEPPKPWRDGWLS